MLSDRDESLLNDLLDGRLDPVEAEAVRSRIAREPALREAWEEVSRLSRLARALPEPALPDDFRERVRARIALAARENGQCAPDELARPGVEPAGIGSARGRTARRVLRLLPLAYAAAALVVAAIGVFWAVDRLGDAPPPAGGDGFAQARRPEEAAEPADRRKAAENLKASPARPDDAAGIGGRGGGYRPPPPPAGEAAPTLAEAPAPAFEKAAPPALRKVAEEDAASPVYVLAAKDIDSARAEIALRMAGLRAGATSWELRRAPSEGTPEPSAAARSPDAVEAGREAKDKGLPENGLVDREVAAGGAGGGGAPGHLERAEEDGAAKDRDESRAAPRVLGRFVIDLDGEREARLGLPLHRDGGKSRGRVTILVVAAD